MIADVGDVGRGTADGWLGFSIHVQCGMCHTETKKKSEILGC